MNYRHLHQLLLTCTLLCGLAACSTKKNTSGTRFYHAMTARFNTYFNGSEAYKEGVKAQTDGHQDDFSALLPIQSVSNKKTAAIGKGEFETAITKSEKAIKQHSIKARPKSSSSKKKTAKEKAYLNRKEFNPFLKHPWLLLGKSQFRQGNFIEAASTFHYIANLYAGQPDVVSVARAYLARCYVQLGWPYDAEDVFNKISRDSITALGKRERDASYADYLILVGRYQEAIPCLQGVTAKEKNKTQRARLNYLTGQLQHLTGDSEGAYRSLRRVIKANPPYELAFNAQILQSEVMAKNARSKTLKKLNRMAKNKKNKDYLDRIYYAIGNIHLSAGDTARCIGAYEKGVKESTQAGAAKATLLLRLGEVYWDKEDYINANRCYAEAIGLLDKEHKAYKETERRANILKEVEPPLSSIKLQDSLQWLAKLPEAERLAAIDKQIELLKKKEKEEARKEMNAKMDQQLSASRAAQPQAARPSTTGAARGQNAQAGGTWYFYNPTLVAQGKQQFQRNWGKRVLEDNWRRSHRREDRKDDMGEYDYAAEDSLQAATDSLMANEMDEEAQRIADSLANDPHHREYYLAQIPLTEEQLQGSNDILRDALYNAGVLEMEKLENFALSVRTLLRLLNDFPDTDKKDDIYYHLFLACGRLGQTQQAEQYRQQLIAECPDSKLAKTLANPRYELYARYGKHIEDSLYAATYTRYTQNSYAEVFDNCQTSAADFPEGAHRAKFLFIEAMSQLYSGHRQEFLVTLKTLISQYPQEEITAMAQYIVKGIEEGRSLTDDKYSASDIWGRRTLDARADTADASNRLSDERITPFVFLLAYPVNTLDENQLLYEMALYNFTGYMTRNFELTIEKAQGIAQLRVSGFQSFDEAHTYAQQLYADPHMNTVLRNIRPVIISEQNLQLLGTTYSYDDYKEFYDNTLAPLPVPEDLQLDEPTDIKVLTPDDLPDDYEEEERQGSPVQDDEDDEGGIIY